MGWMAVLTAASTGIQMLGSIQQGKAAQQSANYNAKVQDNNAQIALQNATMAGREGAANAEKEQLKTRATMGAIKAGQAANGVNVNTGSAVDVQSSASETGMLNAITIRSNAARQAYGYQTQASSDVAQAELDRAQGKSARNASYLNAGTTLLGNTVKGVQSGAYDSLIQSKAINSDDYGDDDFEFQYNYDHYGV